MLLILYWLAFRCQLDIQIPSTNKSGVVLCVYQHVFDYRWCLYSNVGSADCIWKSDGCCKLSFDVGLFIVTVRKLDASGFHPNYTIPHG